MRFAACWIALPLSNNGYKSSCRQVTESRIRPETLKVSSCSSIYVGAFVLLKFYEPQQEWVLLQNGSGSFLP